MYRRILVGTDGSPTAALAVGRAVDVARASGATLTILSAGRPPRANLVVESEAERHAGSGVAIEKAVVDGGAAAALLDAVQEEGFDRLVVGNKGMTGASRFLLGSVPNKVSHHISTALLIVRTT